MKTILPLISDFIDAVMDSRPHFSRMLLQLINIPHWFLIMWLMISCFDPLIEVWTYGRPQVRCGNVWHLTLQHVNGITCMVHQHAVLLKNVKVTSSVIGGGKSLKLVYSFRSSKEYEICR